MSDLLEIAALVLETVKVPEGVFDPSGAWRHTYGLFDLAANLATNTNVVRNQVGAVVLKRAPREGGALLEVDWHRRTPPGTTERITGRMVCAGDALATPKEWEFAWHGQDLALPRKSVGGRVPRGLYTVNWALFDAVQRMAAKPAPAVRFTLLDEFDLMKPNQSLRYRKSAEVKLAGGAVKLNSFEQFGAGVLPIVYWTDERGRLLFVESGLIAYAMQGDAE